MFKTETGMLMSAEEICAVCAAEKKFNFFTSPALIFDL